MGNREDLLAGARQVILERGVAKATARDIATAAGVSLAAIGYHFGSKDRLITEALMLSLGSGLGDDLEALMLEQRGGSMLDDFAAVWNRMPEIFAIHREALLASLENAVRVLRDPESSRHLHAATADGHHDMAVNLRVARPELDEHQAEAVARLYYVLVQSLGILWLLDPDGNLPTGDELAEAIATIAGAGRGAE
ncbi:TetR family transcriptional regulator [Agromyces sp. CFH 90414]|uniref:TetR family transcriptional regulator n=1 Tax=Agromyces agglutinans TaxID=2662258 RepID=A0A6I2F587_9MICO|nr:TetR/AcrR family transcriptional regulator [Agromyces agglutinans]MRG59802.1 TetR family transcriptional regulator [Agromyces agglutinans]